MDNNLKFDFKVDEQDHSITVIREFVAPPDKVWAAWTTAELLDQWWAPKPYKALTKELQLKPGGRWLYAMVGPDASEQWCRAIYSSVDAPNSFSYDDAFCDAQGTVTNDFPGSGWEVRFAGTEAMTTVTVLIRHKSAADLRTILKMGFREGFTAGIGNLDELLAGG